MEGFKNSTRMKTFGDVAPQAYAKGGSVKPAAKVGKVMGEFAEGKLHSGSKTGPKVTNKKQAIAIGISEAKKAGAKAPMKKANGGEIVRMTDAERRASLEVPSRGMTPAEARALRATMAAKAAAPKRAPLIQPRKPMVTPPMSAADRRLIEMDRTTNASGSSEYAKGGKVGASKVPFLEKKTGEKYASKGAMAKHERGESFAVKKAEGEKVMRKAMGGAVNMPEMTATAAPPPPLVTSDYRPAPMPTLETMQSYGGNTPPASAPNVISAQQAAEMARLMGGRSPSPMPTMPDMSEIQAMQARMQAMRAMQDQAATAQAQQEMAAQAQMDQGLGRGLAPMYGRGAPPRFMR